MSSSKHHTRAADIPIGWSEAISRLKYRPISWPIFKLLLYVEIELHEETASNMFRQSVLLDQASHLFAAPAYMNVKYSLC